MICKEKEKASGLEGLSYRIEIENVGAPTFKVIL